MKCMKLGFDVLINCRDFGLPPCIWCQQDGKTKKTYTCAIQQYKVYIKNVVKYDNHHSMRDFIVSELTIKGNPYLNCVYTAIKYYFPEYLATYNKLAVLK